MEPPARVKSGPPPPVRTVPKGPQTSLATRASPLLDALNLHPSASASKGPQRPALGLPLQALALAEPTPQQTQQEICDLITCLTALSRPTPGYQAGIRLSLATAPGYGHQAATVCVYKELRAWGYEGPVEFVCAKSEARTKLAEMLDLKREPNISVRLAAPTDPAVPRTRVAITGAMDFSESARALLHMASLHADHMLFLQPLGWPAPRLVASMSGHILNLGHPAGPLDPQLAAFHIAPPAYLSYSHFLATHMLGEAWQSSPAVNTLAAIRARQVAGNIDTCAVYGRGATYAAQPLVEAIYRRQMDVPQPVKPTAILWLAYENPLVKNVPVIPIDSEQAAHALDDLASNQQGLVIFRAQGLPQPVFFDVFLRSNLPPILEGCNTMNVMRTASQTPYISLCNDDMRTTHVTNLGRLVASHILYSKPREGVLAEFIAQTRDADSPLCRDHAMLSYRSRRPGNNQLLQGLKALVRVAGASRREARSA